MRHQTAQIIRSFVTVLTFAALLLTLSLPVSLHAEQAITIIQVGSEIDFPPYAIVDAHGHAGGFSVELLDAVAKEMGLSIEVHPGQWPEVLANFKAGKFDLLPLVAVSEKRADMASYTKPHTVAYDSFFVRRGSHPLSSLAEARGKEIIVMTNDAAHEALIASGLLFHIVETRTISEAMRILATGSHDAVLVPKLLGQIVLRQLKLEDAIETSPPIPDYSRKFAFAVQSGNTDLRDKLEQGMSLVRASGRYVAIYEKWFGDLEPQSSFTWRQILWAIGTMGLLVMLVLGWIVTLRRQMRIHVAQLKKTTVSIDILQKEVENREQIERALSPYLTH